MPAHDRFEELCALAAIGELSADELRELLDHLKSCSECRRATEDFAFVLDQLPVKENEPDNSETAALLFKGHRQRFLARARAEGIEFSRYVTTEGAPQRVAWLNWRRLTAVLIPTAAAFAAFLIGMRLAPGRRVDAIRLTFTLPAPPIAVAPPIRAIEPNAISEEKSRGLTQQIELLRAKLSATQVELADVMKRSGQADERVAELERQLQAVKDDLAQTSAQADKLRGERNQTTADLVQQKYRILQLDEQIKSQSAAVEQERKRQTAAVEQERQLMAASQDVRQMMGARNLHIIDVFDADGHGSKKSFGRVFYVEGKSLIFYAFDLTQKSSRGAKVSFQAWGQREAVKNIAKNLGMFYIDDHDQRRWVLKVDDPDKLASIDSVFVTVEPFGGTDRPTGQKLLYAYLGSPANHP